jgi:methyl-accepting chemotaxis protein
MKINLSRRLGDIKIGRRLVLSYSMIFVLVLMLIGFFIYSQQVAKEHTRSIAESDISMLNLSAEIKDNVSNVLRAVRTALLARNDAAELADQKNKIEVARKKYNEAFKSLLAQPGLDEFERGSLQKINETTLKLREMDDTILALNDKGNQAEAVDFLLTKARPVGYNLTDLLDEFSAYQRKTANDNYQEVVRLEKQANITSAALSGLLVLLIAVLAFLITRSITHPLGALQKAINDVRQGGNLDALAHIDSKDEMNDMGFAVNQVLVEQISAREKAETENEKLNNSVIALLQAVFQLSQKDLTARAPLSGDIIDTVADSINLLTDETAKVLQGVNQIAAQVELVSGKVRSQGDLVAATSLEERKNVDEMILSLGESAKAMAQIANMTTQSNHSAERASQATSTALDTVNSTVKGMESIRETIAETEKRIKRLGERSQEISGIVNLINTISERTHVLALNASMQAAVAGDAGRGFAVVAEEVQRLAESSRNATQQIGTLVNNIQLETNETISTVNRTIGQVVQGSEQAQKAGEHMRLTQEITGELVAQVQTIAQAYGLQKKTSDMLLESVQRLGQSNERTAQQIDTQGKETQTLIDSARQLVESVNVFKLPQLA